MKEQIYTIFISVNEMLKEFDSIDFFYILSMILIAISLFVIAYIGSRFLAIWNRELQNKKIKLLASNIMEEILNIQDIILKIREPFSFPSETEEIINNIKKYHYFPLNENKIKYLIPFYRSQKYKKEFEQFKNLRTQAQLYWKEDILDLFKKTTDIIETIECSARMLYECELSKEDTEKYQRNIWNNKELDIINPEIQKIVKEFKTNLEKLYKTKRKSWKKLTK